MEIYRVKYLDVDEFEIAIVALETGEYDETLEALAYRASQPIEVARRNYSVGSVEPLEFIAGSDGKWHEIGVIGDA